MHLRSLAAALLAASSLSCLPAETRTVPGSLVVRAAAREPYGQGADGMSADGWRLHIERLYVTLGSVALEGDACEAYTDASYSRVLDFLRTDVQKVSLSYALGDCQLAFAASAPRWNTIPGEGVPPEFIEQLRSPGEGDDAGGISIYLAGEARREGELVRFEWPFRVQLFYRKCGLLDDAGALADLSFASGQQRELDIEVDAFALFRAEPGSGELQFGPFAEADRDANGDLSLAELELADILEGPLGSRLQHLLALPGGRCAAFDLCERACKKP